MKAIETVYHSTRFRSRTEARHAVFFDMLGIPWEYEKEGFVLENGITYLPDFWLPSLNCWLEVKGQEPTDEERNKAILLSKATGKYVYISWGILAKPEFVAYEDIDFDNLDNSQTLVDIEAFLCVTYPDGRVEDAGLGGGFLWYECPQCRKVGISYGGVYNRHRFCKDTESLNPLSLRLKAAYAAARQARFEFGETPR